MHFVDCFSNMLNETNIILFFFVHTVTHYVILFTYSYSLFNYPVSTLSYVFLLYMYAVAILWLVLVQEIWKYHDNAV